MNQVPLAVWATADRTLPVATAKPVRAGYTIDDLSMRLATISAAWSVLSIYAPYFADQHIDWRAALPGALREAANARSPAETYVALAHLLAQAHDDHISIKHPAAPRNGVLPVMVRRFGDKLIVIGGLPAYLGEVPIGSEVLAVQGAPALEAFTQIVEPAVQRFEPELVLVSAGFDAHVADPLSDMRVTEDGFRELSRRCRALSDRVAAVLEGGYDLETLPGLVDAALDGFSG